MARKKVKQDKLERDVEIAKELGVSYGELQVQYYLPKQILQFAAARLDFNENRGKKENNNGQSM